MQDLKSLNTYAVFGIGRSGVAAANLLAKHNKTVILSDTRDEAALEEALNQVDDRVKVATGGNVYEGADVVIVSPGLHPRVPIFEKLDAAGIPYVSEIELAYQFASAPFVAISGTDGKTTTTTLVGDMFSKALEHVVVAGNIGTPLCEVVEDIPSNGMIVAEVSAFQLWTTTAFRAVATGVTNIAYDHMDYFAGDTNTYAEAKRQTLYHAQPNDWAILNAMDPIVRTWSEGYDGPVAYYGYGEDPMPEHSHVLWSDGTRFHGRWDGASLGVWLDGTDDLPLQGAHQHLNMLCATGMALSQGVEMAHILDALRQFQPLPHRMEPCGQRDGVRFWDDSKATNVHAALAGLRGLKGKVVAIVGGLDKGLPLDDLIEHLRDHAPYVLAIGDLTDRLTAELVEAGYPAEQIVSVQSMEEAVERGFALARDHHIEHLSLSPACSSFDMYQSYAHRGDLFKDCVRSLLAQ